MHTILTVLLVAAMIATLLILLLGVISFSFDTKLNKTASTRLMAARVAMQGIALVLFALVVLSST